MRKILVYLLLTTASIIIFVAQNLSASESNVIYFGSNSKVIDPYFKKIRPEIENRKASVKKRKSNSILNNILPIRTPSMKVGRVTRKTNLLNNITVPTFLIGSDNTSIEWVRKHYQQLRKMGAIGMLINAETLHDLKKVAAVSKGLKVIPKSAESVAKEMQLTAYPVLITSNSIQQ